MIYNHREHGIISRTSEFKFQAEDLSEIDLMEQFVKSIEDIGLKKTVERIHAKEKQLSDFCEEEIIKHLSVISDSVYVLPDTLMETQLLEAFKNAIQRVKWPELLERLNKR